jgi:dephospho-CoA kinase
MGVKIAVTGRIRSGKETLAKVFIQDGYREFKFGTGIAEVIQKYFPEEWAKGKPRQHYQSIGQHFRGLDPDVCVKYTLRQVNECTSLLPHADVIIDDMRQMNEAEHLRKAGFVLIKVVSKEELRIQRMIDAGDTFTQETLNHETELQSDMIDADITVCNNGSLRDFIRKAREIKQMIEGA